MNHQIFRSEDRGFSDLGWLKSRHSFSFGSFFNPQLMGFGALRVLNDDIVGPGAGFNTHPHDNMEIISIPLEGSLEHRDSMGNHGFIPSGEIQAMSAGTGIFHSEYNQSGSSLVKFLQIWIVPNKRNVSPRYAQMKIKPERHQNQFGAIISPVPGEETIWIHQNASLFLGNFEAEKVAQIPEAKNGIGNFLFVLKGKINLFGSTLHDRDAIGITDSPITEVSLMEQSQLLLLQVPLNPYSKN